MLFGIGCDSPQPTANLAEQQLVHSIQKSTYIFDARLATVEVVTPKGLGTGIIVGRDRDEKQCYVITAAHVVKDYPTPTVAWHLYAEDTHYITTKRAKVLKFDAKLDTALLLVKDVPNIEKITPIYFASERIVHTGMEVFYVGNPTGFYQTVAFGRVQHTGRGISAMGRKMFVIQTGGMSGSGGSGGGLFNPINGKCIAILTLISERPPHVNFWIPSDKVLKWVEDENLGFAITR